jgi:hypothetical protein
MTAAIVIDDSINPPVTGSVDLDASFLAKVFTVSNFNNSNVLAHRWTLVDKPIGSSASLATPTAPTSTITPDIPGSYLIRLETFLDVGATDADDADEQIIGIRFVAPFDWLVPAAGETSQQDATRGWAEAREEAIRAVRQNLMSEPSAVVTAGPVTATQGELVLYDPSGGTFTINAPTTPVFGYRWAIKNTTVSAVSVTISGNGNNIEDPNTSTFLASFGLAVPVISLDFLFDGTNWVIV